MFFVKQFNVRGRQAQYKFVSKSNKGVVLSAIKFRDKYFDIYFTKKEFEDLGVEVSGWNDYFIVKEDCVLNRPQTGEIPIKANTYFIHEKMQELQPDDEPLVKIQVPGGEIVLNYEEWRRLRFEIDEMFLLKGRIPD